MYYTSQQMNVRKKDQNVVHTISRLNHLNAIFIQKILIND